eukprot:TRINITY_DN4035_c0_g2_i1.p1 TRINITY_DN4035_c0_g2~~TRINITY_DN4035_c0_g2_i1.p1  ORF type:complete len:312 (+),score=56.15 TRINITY_DN4035_c0_g2_i1:305-1240(+)
MLGLDPPLPLRSSRVDWRRQNLIDLKRTQIRNREKKAQEHPASRGPLKANYVHHSPRLLEEIDIPEVDPQSSANIYSDVSLQARRTKVEDILNDIWAVEPLSDQGTYYSSSSRRGRRSRSQSKSSRISVAQHLPKQSFLDTNRYKTGGSASTKMSNSTPDLSKMLTDTKKAQPPSHRMNYVKANAVNIAPRRLPSRSESTRSEVLPARPGTIPKYLKQRKEQWKKDAEVRERSKPDPDCPPGHALLSESKRVFQLESLEAKMKDLVHEFSSLPMGRSTLRITSRKKEIENDMRETEDSLRRFAKPRVYVPL